MVLSVKAVPVQILVDTEHYRIHRVSCLLQLFTQNPFGYVLPITSFVVAWLETWFLDFKVLTQEAEDERGELPRQADNVKELDR